MATALGPLLGILRAYRTGGNPPGGGPSWRIGMSFTLTMPGFFLIAASVIFGLSLSLCNLVENGNMGVLRTEWVEIGEEAEEEMFVNKAMCASGGGGSVLLGVGERAFGSNWKETGGIMDCLRKTSITPQYTTLIANCNVLNLSNLVNVTTNLQGFSFTLQKKQNKKKKPKNPKKKKRHKNIN